MCTVASTMEGADQRSQGTVWPAAMSGDTVQRGEAPSPYSRRSLMQTSKCDRGGNVTVGTYGWEVSALICSVSCSRIATQSIIPLRFTGWLVLETISFSVCEHFSHLSNGFESQNHSFSYSALRGHTSQQALCANTPYHEMIARRSLHYKSISKADNSK